MRSVVGILTSNLNSGKMFTNDSGSYTEQVTAYLSFTFRPLGVDRPTTLLDVICGMTLTFGKSFGFQIIVYLIHHIQTHGSEKTVVLSP